MSLSVDVRFDSAQATRLLRALSRRGVHDATVRALNKAANQTKTQASKSIRAKRALKAGVVNEQLKVTKAARKAEAAVVATGAPIPLRDYGARQTARGVTFRVNRGKRSLLKGAFIVQSIGQHVFTRSGPKRKMKRGRYVGKKKQPIIKRVAPSLPSTFVRDEVIRAMHSKVASIYPRLIGHEVEREIAKLTRRIGREVKREIAKLARRR